MPVICRFSCNLDKTRAGQFPTTTFIYVSKVDMSTRDQYRDITGGKASFPQDMEPLLNYMFFGQFSTTTFFYFLFFLSFVLIFS